MLETHWVLGAWLLSAEVVFPSSEALTLGGWELGVVLCRLKDVSMGCRYKDM